MMTDEALQWHNMPTRARQIVSSNIREAGMNITRSAGEQVEKFKNSAETGSTASARELAGRKARGLAPVVAELRDKPVTQQRAANTRRGFYSNALKAKRDEGNTDNVIPDGAGWYYQHHADIKKSAEQHGFDHRAAIAASGVMSPQNSPDNEKAAVGAMMDTIANHKVTVTPRVAQHLSSKGIDVSQHVGKEVHFDQLPTGSIAHLSGTEIRSHVPTTAPLREVARGGTKQNIARAESVLWGDTKPEDSVSPHTAPKVWSYVHNTLAAEPNSAEHIEYMGRVHQDALVHAGHISPDQQTFDFSDPSKSNHLLSPKSHTVEDTWQNAATFDQPHKTVGSGRTSVFKAGGSLPDTYPVRGVNTTIGESGKRESAIKGASNSALTHAFNNRATQKAAEQQGRSSGVSLPPVAMQEVGWTQMRREVGKDAEFNHRASEVAPTHTEIPGQKALFGPHTPGVARMGGPKVENHPEDTESEGKWAAIGKAHRSNQMRAGREARGAQYASEFNQRFGLS